MTVSWRDAMNVDIKRFFNVSEPADIVDIDTNMRDEPAGGNQYWSVFIVEVTFRIDGVTRTEAFRGTMFEFLDAVCEAANPADPQDVQDTKDETEAEHHYWDSTPPY